MEKLSKFFELIRNQFVYGGQKYAHSSKKESTDCLFDDFGKNWLLGTLAKYCKRYSNLARERDLLKIACYCFIIWLKRGFHYGEFGTSEVIDTTVDIKSKYFDNFILRNKNFIKDFKVDEEDNQIDRIYTILFKFAHQKFQYMKEDELFTIFALSYYIWDKDIKNKGKDEDVYNETGGAKPKDKKKC